AELDRRQNAMRTEQEQLTAAQAHGENVAGRQASFQQEYTALQAEYMQFQNELQQAEQVATASILEQLKSTLGTMARQRAIDFVLDTGGGDTSYHGPRVVDLTNDLIHTYDATHH